MKDVVKFRALIGIAKADGEFDAKEQQFIKQLANVQGYTVSELKSLLKEGDKTGALIKDLSLDDKIDILTYMVQLMKIDGKVLLSEISFGEKVARALGFDEKCIGFLSEIVESNPEIAPNIGTIRHRIVKYLIAPS